MNKKKKKFSANSCFALAPLFELNVASQWQLKRPGYSLCDLKASDTH